MIRNSLILNRLFIYTKEGKIAYDENFHQGVNIIRGENSSGKSTISHFIFYILGGAFNDWVKEAKKCSEVYAEISLNGSNATIRREVVDHTKAPIYFYWGDLNSVLNPADGVEIEWKKFGYDTTTEKKSFSNVFFDNLNIPIVYGDNNISMHQILRLLYVDQDSPTNSLFLYEQFDSQLTRMTIADLLLGVYDDTLYQDKIDQRNTQSKYDDILSEIKGIKKFIGTSNDLNPVSINTKIDNSEKEIAKIEQAILDLKNEIKRVNYTAKSKLEFEKLNADAIVQRERVKLLEERESLLKYELNDTSDFISTLEDKLKSVKNSIATRQFLGEFPLEHCPECLSPISESTESGKCKLCKSDVDQTHGITQARKIEQELDFQIKESKKNIGRKYAELESTQISLDSERIKLNQIQANVNSALKDVKSFREERIDQLLVDKGYLEGEILQYRTLLENAEAYANLIENKGKLETKLELLKESIRFKEAQQEKRKEQIKDKIESFALNLLRNDLYRQDEFKNAKSFNIDFRNNLAFLDDKDLRYSASSDFYLKTTARFSIFFASLEIDAMRYPRFILCDNMEDKGIEEIRAQNFQKLLISNSKKYSESDFQMIYTTSFITPELNKSQYVVGDFYSKSNPSLKNV